MSAPKNLPTPEQCVWLLRFIANDIAQWEADEKQRRGDCDEETACARLLRTGKLPGEFRRRVAASREAAEFADDHGGDDGAMQGHAPRRRRPGSRR